MRFRYIPFMGMIALASAVSFSYANPYPQAPSGAYSPGYQGSAPAPQYQGPRSSGPYQRSAPSAGKPSADAAKSSSRTPLDVLKAGIDMLQDFIASGDIYDQDKLERFVNSQVKPFFDFDEMSRLVAGRFYSNLDKAQRAQFQSRVENMFLIAFTRQVSQHAGPQPQVDFLRPRFKGPDEVEALARVLFADGSAKRLVFRFHRGDKGWRVYDVAANGTSAVLYYRRHFLEQVRRHGPEALLK